MYVHIVGIEQWVQFNENEREYPILLYLHGGPGGTSVPLGRQMQIWVMFDAGWRIVAAHLSMIDGGNIAP